MIITEQRDVEARIMHKYFPRILQRAQELRCLLEEIETLHKQLYEGIAQSDIDFYMLEQEARGAEKEIELENE